MRCRFVSRSLGIIGVVCGSLWCLAAVHAASQPQPADPGARVLRTEYRSAFARYRAFRDERLANWKSLNEDVERAGGHLGIMRATPAPIPPAPAKPAPAGRGTTHH